MPTIPVSWGELIDKITILEIKADRLTDAAAWRNVMRELHRIAPMWPNNGHAEALRADLKAINTRLWGIEDDIRRKEAAKDFGPEFVELARLVYQTNDIRSRIKRQINELLDSDLIEEKQYAEYAS